MSDGAFAAQWGLTRADMALLETSTAATRLGLAAQLKSFQNDGVFPSAWSELGEEVRAWLAEQLGLAPNAGAGYAFEGRTGRRHRADIARHLGLRRLDDAGRATLGGWIARVLCPQALSASAMLEAALRWCRDHGLIAPSRKVVERLVRSERQRFHEGILGEATARLSPEMAERLEAVLGEPEAAMGFHRLKADVGAATLESVLAATGRLGFIKELALPRDLLAGPARPWIERIARRVGAETATEMRRHPRERRLGMLALWLMVRESRLTDAVVDLLIETVHKIASRARRKVSLGLGREIERVHGKERLLGLDRRGRDRDARWRGARGDLPHRRRGAAGGDRARLQ